MKRMTRDEAVASLEAELLTLVDDEHSICAVAAEKGIFCGGFAQWTFQELKRQYPQIVRSRPRITPRRLRELADRWQVARRRVHDTSLACRTQMHESAFQTCKGWDEWDDGHLARFHRELCGEEIEIVPEAKEA